MKNRKKLSTLLMLITITTAFLLNIVPVFATQTGRITSTTGVKLRKDAGTSYTSIITVPHNTIVNINSTKKTSDGSTGCSTGIWTNITYNSSDKKTYTGYICSKYIEENSTEIDIPTSDIGSMTDKEFDEYLTKQGFPDSYKIKLKELHKKHKNWVFVAVKTKDNWKDTVKAEMYPRRSLYQSLRDGSKAFLSTADGDYNWYTDKFTAYDGTTWFQANEDTVEHFLDPRNFLTEERIFMFEDALYYPSYQTSKAVEGVLTSNFMRQFIPHFMSAAELYNVSPIYLSSLSRQEVGLNSSTATDGKYNGHYNFYNIGAYAGSNAVYLGLDYAKKKGWDTPKKAIEGGAAWIVDGYINAGQHTPYLQKWNVKDTPKNKGYAHQYMQNIEAVYSSSKSTKNSYQSMGMLEYPFIFAIPVFNNMPSSTPLPKEGNPNNYLKTLTVNNLSVSNFDGANTNYKVTVSFDATEAKIGASTVNKNATTSGIGTIKLTSKTTNTSVKVTAQNGNIKTYNLTIVKNDPPTGETGTDPEEPDKGEGDKEETTPPTPTPPISVANTIKKAGYKHDSNYLWNVSLGSGVSTIINKLQSVNAEASINIKTANNKAKTSGTLVTGDKIIIKSGSETKTLSIVIFGDVNGDGLINTKDLLKVQKNILGDTKLNSAYAKGADTNKDGKINTKDLLQVQKHILRDSNISQS